jgi:hypothetical protein
VKSKGEFKFFRLTILTFFCEHLELLYGVCDLGLTLERGESRILFYYLKKITLTTAWYMQN